MDKSVFLCTKYLVVNIRIIYKWCLLGTLLSTPLLFLMAQEVKKSSSTLQRAADRVSKELEEETTDDETLASSYVQLAKELTIKQEYAKAEEYWEKAWQLYDKLGLKDKSVEVIRELAKLHEMQGNTTKAAQLFETAGINSLNTISKELNLNDAQRLKNADNPTVQSVLIERKIELLQIDKEVSVEEVAKAHTQMADVSAQMNEPQLALEHYETALQNVSEKTAEALTIQRKIAEVYFNEQQPDKGIHTLDEVYRMALADHNTIEAAKSLEHLAREYRKQGNDKKAITLYQDFLHGFEELIRADSSLIDVKIFHSTEERMTLLEKEKALKDALINKKNSLNKVLIWSVVLMALFLFLLTMALRSIHIRNKKIALQSLRREMNPHFIFNSLNSVNQYIAQNDEVAANKYLTSYSRLMRNTMENSHKDFIRLDHELALLTEYLELEHLRFGNKFSYKMVVDAAVETSALYVPGMLIQPYLENAIWHGLRYKEHSGWLQLTVAIPDQMLCIVIEDNGIGIAKSKALKTANQKAHQPRGLNNINERIKLLRDIYKISIRTQINEKSAPECGVRITITLPLMHHVKS